MNNLVFVGVLVLALVGAFFVVLFGLSQYREDREIMDKPPNKLTRFTDKIMPRKK